MTPPTANRILDTITRDSHPHHLTFVDPQGTIPVKRTSLALPSGSSQHHKSRVEIRISTISRRSTPSNSFFVVCIISGYNKCALHHEHNTRPPGYHFTQHLSALYTLLLTVNTHTPPTTLYSLPRRQTQYHFSVANSSCLPSLAPRLLVSCTQSQPH